MSYTESKMRYCIKFFEALNEYVIHDAKSPADAEKCGPALWEGDDREQAMAECQRLNRTLGNKYRRGMHGER